MAKYSVTYKGNDSSNLGYEVIEAENYQIAIDNVKYRLSQEVVVIPLKDSEGGTSYVEFISTNHIVKTIVSFYED